MHIEVLRRSKRIQNKVFHLTFAVTLQFTLGLTISSLCISKSKSSLDLYYTFKPFCSF